MADFFISYTGTDRPWAEWIAWVLKEAGFSVTLQAWDFRPGNNFVVEMQRAATGSDRTVAVLSPDYLRSLYAMAEWAVAFEADPDGTKGKLVPVLVREAVPEGLLASIIRINLVGLGEAAAREELLKGLEAQAGERSVPRSAPVPRSHSPISLPWEAFHRRSRRKK
jgi:TIR domain